MGTYFIEPAHGHEPNSLGQHLHVIHRPEESISSNVDDEISQEQVLRPENIVLPTPQEIFDYVRKLGKPEYNIRPHKMPSGSPGKIDKKPKEGSQPGSSDDTKSQALNDGIMLN